MPGKVVVTTILSFSLFVTSVLPIAALEQVYFVHSDHLGSTSLTTNDQGKVISNQTYFPFGSTRSRHPELVSESQPIEREYTGQISDKDATGLYYYNARYYNPLVAKFTQADSIGGGNRYTYVGNNPVMMIDPSGHVNTSYEENPELSKWLNTHYQESKLDKGQSAWAARYQGLADDYGSPCLNCHNPPPIQVPKVPAFRSECLYGCHNTSNTPYNTGTPMSQEGQELMADLVTIPIQIVNEPLDWLITLSMVARGDGGWGDVGLMALPGSFSILRKLPNIFSFRNDARYIQGFTQFVDRWKYNPKIEPNLLTHPATDLPYAPEFSGGYDQFKQLFASTHPQGRMYGEVYNGTYAITTDGVLRLTAQDPGIVKHGMLTGGTPVHVAGEYAYTWTMQNGQKTFQVLDVNISSGGYKPNLTPEKIDFVKNILTKAIYGQ